MSSGARAGRRLRLPVLPNANPARSADPRAGLQAHGDPLPRVAIVTLGCDKNTVDSERLAARLLGEGAELSENVEGADVVLVNTCGFIDVAKEESVDALLDAVHLKAQGRVGAVVAVGCLVQRYKEQLAAEIPEVDLFLGLTEIGRLTSELRAMGRLPSATPVMERSLRALTSRTRHTAFLKISEGCDHGCAFCAIPLMRGKFRSAPMEVLVAEARELELRGAVELNIVSQDTTWYGRDWRRGGSGADMPDSYFVGRPFRDMAGPSGAVADVAGTTPVESRVETSSWKLAESSADPRRGALPALLRGLIQETDVPWIRLFYMYPSGITRELVELMGSEPRIVPYLDMPIQHGSDTVLKRMRRPERQATIRERVSWLRDAIPDLALRTTVIVGFPGETDEDFDALLRLLEEVRFDRVGAFAYSQEDSTPAASMPDQVPASLTRERLERLQDLQRSIGLDKNESLIGRTMEVLVEGRYRDGRAGSYGRTTRQAAEVDGVVGLKDGAPLRPGDFVPVRIQSADADDLEGVVVRGA